jgi:hypothetical protein
MNEKSTRRAKGIQKMTGLAIKPGLGLAEVFRMIGVMVRRVLFRPASEAWDEGEAAPEPKPMGMRFRERR